MFTLPLNFRPLWVVVASRNLLLVMSISCCAASYLLRIGVNVAFKSCYMLAVCYVILVVVCLYVMTVVCIVMFAYYDCCFLYCYVMFVIVNVVINATCIYQVLFCWMS